MSVSVVSPVFIGRRDELELLAAPVRRAQGGEPAVALIGGDSGERSPCPVPGEPVSGHPDVR